MDEQPAHDLPDALDAIIRRLQAIADDPATDPELAQIVTDLLREIGIIFRSN